FLPSSSRSHLWSPSAFNCDHRILHSFPTRRSSDLIFIQIPHLTLMVSMKASLTTPQQRKVQKQVFLWIVNKRSNILFNFLIQIRSEEHTSELQSRENLVCRLLLEKKNTNLHITINQ